MDDEGDARGASPGVLLVEVRRIFGQVLPLREESHFHLKRQHRDEQHDSQDQVDPLVQCVLLLLHQINAQCQERQHGEHRQEDHVQHQRAVVPQKAAELGEEKEGRGRDDAQG